MQKRFALLQSYRAGHRWFIDNATGRIAIADQSGDTPDRTDDGILYLDTTRDVGESTIPLVHPTGEPTRTPACKEEREMFVALRNGKLGLHLRT
jgi:hypothetical protein